MPRFALKFPYFIIMICPVVALIETFTVMQMPVDLFPPIDMPLVVAATFYNGMPPQQIESDITNTFERFFTLRSNIDPVVLGTHASTRPVCLVTLEGQGLNETHLKDLAQFQVRNQISSVQGASVPQLATLLGMIPMALGLEAGSEQYAPLARAIIGGLAVPVVVTMFLVPAVDLIIHGQREGHSGNVAVAEGRA